MSILRIRQPLTNCVGTAVKRNIDDSYKFSLGKNVLWYSEISIYSLRIRICFPAAVSGNYPGDFGSEIFVI